jgi:hypothetical protein
LRSLSENIREKFLGIEPRNVEVENQVWELRKKLEKEAQSEKTTSFAGNTARFWQSLLVPGQNVMSKSVGFGSTRA